MQLWMNRKMEQKNKSNQCSSLFSSGIFITSENELKSHFFSSSLRCNKLVPERMTFSCVDKVVENFGRVFIIQQPIKQCQYTINNNDTKKVDQHCIKTLFTFLETSSFSFSFFFQVIKKSLHFFALSSSSWSSFAFFSFFFVCFVYSIIHKHNSFSTMKKNIYVHQSSRRR